MTATSLLELLMAGNCKRPVNFSHWPYWVTQLRSLPSGNDLQFAMDDMDDDYCMKIDFLFRSKPSSYQRVPKINGKQQQQQQQTQTITAQMSAWLTFSDHFRRVMNIPQRS